MLPDCSLLNPVDIDTNGEFEDDESPELIEIAPAFVATPVLILSVPDVPVFKSIG
jgi:hypothetical protein